MIPSGWDEDRPCYSATSATPHLREKHKGHVTSRDCYLATWLEPPLPWVRRVNLKVPRKSYHGDPQRRSWHLALGIRRDTGDVQVYCNVGSGPGPFQWRAIPVLDWHKEPGQWFCRRCVAEWTKEVKKVSVDVGVLKITKGQMRKLLAEIEGPDATVLELRAAAFGDNPAVAVKIGSGSKAKDIFIVDSATKLIV